MPLVVALLVLGVLLAVLWVAFAKENGPAAADVAIAYEHAWDSLDFDMLYDLSGVELRDGMNREAFVAAKRAAYRGTPARVPLASGIRVEEVVAANQTAVVVTRIETADGNVRNNITLEKRPAGWVVVAYALRPDAAP